MAAAAETSRSPLEDRGVNHDGMAISPAGDAGDWSRDMHFNGPIRSLKVAVCIPTCRRPNLLAGALDSIAGQVLVRHPGARVRVCVVDNDADASARGLVESKRQQIPWPLVYAVEPRRGISHARNRLIELAGEVDFVAFLDDDEVAQPGWLDALLTVQTQTSGAVVIGPVMPQFLQPPPPHIRDALADRERHPDGAEVGLSAFATNNLLLELSVLGGNRNPFDPQFGLTGGEDAFLARQLRRLGVRFYWAESAGVREIIPPARATAAWLVRRQYRVGSTAAAIDRRMQPGLGPVMRLLKGIANVAVGCFSCLPFGLIWGRGGLLRSLCHLSKGVGSIAGVAGARYLEYRTVRDAGRGPAGPQVPAP